MCGIAGAIAFNPNGEGIAEDLRAATAALSHRGPGGEGIYQRDNVGLGHRYLPIMDPGHGQQPMHRGTRFTISFNGEIYNAPDLRRELEAQGQSFTTRTDTEVVLAAFEAWGTACIPRLRGMFALALADWDKGEVVLARDPLGIKPLVYADSPALFAFASEIQALRKFRAVRAAEQIDLLALDDYLRLLYIPAPRTIFTNIRKLPAGHTLTLNVRTGERVMQRFWTPRYEPNEKRTAAEWQEATEAIVRESIRLHTIADVKVGVLLSGGVDSTLVAMEMKRLGNAVQTFTTGFSDQSGRDERVYASQVASKLGTAHHETMVPASIMDVLPAAARACGEPFGDSSLLCAWEVCRFAKEQVDVVLTGDGCDEFFGGYPLYREWQRRTAWSSGPHPLWKQLLAPALHALRPQRFPTLTDGEPEAAQWAQCVEYGDADFRHRLWRGELWREAFASPAPDAIQRCFASHPGLRGITRPQSCDIEIYLPGDILPKVDAASMAHSLEARTPLVDVRVAEFAATIPAHILATGNPGHASTWIGKQPLKQWMAAHMPPALAHRQKQGFTAPLHQWLTKDPSTRDHLRAALDSDASPLRQWFEASTLRDLQHSHDLHRQWQMLFLATWADQL
jgi:asparagine synthase (glutamine-hydrolysing)